MEQNEKIKAVLRLHKINYYSLAEELECSKNTVFNWLEKPLNPERLEKITCAIDSILKKRGV